MMEGALLADIGTPRVERRRRSSRTKCKEEGPDIFHLFLPECHSMLHSQSWLPMGPCALELPPHMISKPGWQLESRLRSPLKTHPTTPSWKVHQNSRTHLNSSFSAAPAHSATHLWVTAGGRLRLVPTLYNLPNRHGRAPCPSSSLLSSQDCHHFNHQHGSNTLQPLEPAQ